MRDMHYLDRPKQKLIFQIIWHYLEIVTKEPN